MKTIKSIKQLQAEKKRMTLRRQELEKRMGNNWAELKSCIQPANIAADTLNSTIKNKTAEKMEHDSILKSTFTYGITLLASKIVNKAGDKLNKLFKK
jgi:cell division septum initiation protein DivIVA